MLPADLPWRQNDRALDQAFPQNADLLVVVIDGQTGDIAENAAHELAERLRAKPELFSYVRRPDGGEFFDRYGPLFLSVPELQSLSDKLVEAQPLIGTLARDPSLRGLFDTLALFVNGAEKEKDYAAIARLDPTLTAVGDAVQAVLEGRHEPVPWQRLMTGLSNDRRELRRFVLTRPVLDFDTLESGARARAAIRGIARELNLDPAHGVRVRLTGPVPLNDEQFVTLKQGAVELTVLSFVLVLALLLGAVRSLRLVGSIFATLLAGLVLTAAFAALAIGSLNLISVAFGVLFIGLGVDFGIQFSVRYRDERYRRGNPVCRRRCAVRPRGSGRRSCWPALRPRSAFWPLSRPAIPGFASWDGSPVSACWSPSCSISCCCRRCSPWCARRGEAASVGFRLGRADRPAAVAPAALGPCRRRCAGRGLVRAAALCQL